MNNKKLLFIQFIWRFLAPIFIPFFLVFARKTNVKTTHFNQKIIQRYRLPKWAAWAETPDEHLPGGVGYEPTVEKVYQIFGWFICSWYWLGFRNVGQGILWQRGLLVGKIYPDNIDFNNEKILKAARAQIIYDYRLKPTYWGPFKFYYELVKDWYGDHSGRPDDNWQTVDYVAVLRLGLRF